MSSQKQLLVGAPWWSSGKELVLSLLWPKFSPSSGNSDLRSHTAWSKKKGLCYIGPSVLAELKSQGHGGADKAPDLRQRVWAPSSLPNIASLCTSWEVTLPPGTPLSSWQKEGRNPCHALSCDAKAASVKKLCICVMV